MFLKSIFSDMNICFDNSEHWKLFSQNRTFQMYPVWKEKVREYLGRPICYFSSLFNFQLIAKLNFKKNRKQNDWKFTANRVEIKMATKDRFRVTVKAPWTEFSLSVLYFHSISIQFSFNFHSIEWKLNVTEKTTWVNLMFYRMKVISNIIFSLIYEIPEYIDIQYTYIYPNIYIVWVIIARWAHAIHSCFTSLIHWS